MTPPVQLNKPKSTSKLKLTSKPLPANLTLKLVPPETWSDAEECGHTQLAAGGDTRRAVGTDVAPINNFVQWFQAISADMNTEAQRRALAASRMAASSVFPDVGDDEASSIAVKTAPVQSRDGGCPPSGRQLKLNKFWPAREQLDLRLPPLKHSQSQS